MKDQKVFISEADAYLFGKGTHYDIYRKLGAHPSVENRKKGLLPEISLIRMTMFALRAGFAALWN